MTDFEPVEAAKLVFVEAIANRIRKQYPTQLKAAAELGIDHSLINKLCQYETRRFSLNWLINLSTRLGADISITVE